MKVLTTEIQAVVTKIQMLTAEIQAVVSKVHITNILNSDGRKKRMTEEPRRNMHGYPYHTK